MKLKPYITFPSEVLVTLNARLSRAPRSTKFMLEKVPLNYPVYALHDIETAVREGFCVGQKMSFCGLNSFCSRISISFRGLRLYCINLSF